MQQCARAQSQRRGSSIGAGKNARRASFVHLYFNIIAAIIILPLFYLINAFAAARQRLDGVRHQLHADHQYAEADENQTDVLPLAVLLEHVEDNADKGKQRRKGLRRALWVTRWKSAQAIS